MALIARDDGTVEMASLSTSLSGTSIPLNRRWMIVYDGSNYSFQYVGTSSLSLQPSPGAICPGNNIIAAMAGTNSRHWSMDLDTSIDEQLLLINTQTGMPADNVVKYVTAGKTFTLSDISLIAVFVSLYTNQQDIDWTSLSPSVAKINESSGAIRGIWEGQATITATNDESVNSLSYTLKVTPIPDGTYFVRNREYGAYLQAAASDASNNYATSGAAMEQWMYEAGNHQKWKFTLLSDGYYSIISVKSGLALSVPAGKTSSVNVQLAQEQYQGRDRQKWKITQTDDYCYIIKPKSSEGLSSNLVMGVRACDPTDPSGAQVEQVVYSEDGLWRDEWQICSFVDFGLSTDDYSGDNDRKRASYYYADGFYNELTDSTGMPASKIHHYNKDSVHTASKEDFSKSGAISNDIDFMIYVGHGHPVHTGDENNRKYNHIQYSHSTDGALNFQNMCTSSYEQLYKDSFCLYTDEVKFGSPSSDLRWVWMYTCNFLHAKEDNNDNDSYTDNDNDYVTNAMLKELMNGAHIVLGYASKTTLCDPMALKFAQYLQEGMPIIDAHMLAGSEGEASVEPVNHYQKMLYIPQTRYETIYSPQIRYEYSLSDVQIWKYCIHNNLVYN